MGSNRSHDFGLLNTPYGGIGERTKSPNKEETLLVGHAWIEGNKRTALRCFILINIDHFLLGDGTQVFYHICLNIATV